MKTRTRKPAHPGGILRRLYLEPMGLTITELAKALRVSRKTVSKVVNENGSITPDMALRLSAAFDTSPQLWLNLQQAYDLWHSSRSGIWKKIQKIAA